MFAVISPEKKGNSDSFERMDLLDRFHKIFPEAEIAYLCGDREFIGQEWVSYLSGVLKPCLECLKLEYFVSNPRILQILND